MEDLDKEEIVMIEMEDLEKYRRIKELMNNKTKRIICIRCKFTESHEDYLCPRCKRGYIGIGMREDHPCTFCGYTLKQVAYHSLNMINLGTLNKKILGIKNQVKTKSLNRRL